MRIPHRLGIAPRARSVLRTRLLLLLAMTAAGAACAGRGGEPTTAAHRPATDPCVVEVAAALPAGGSAAGAAEPDSLVIAVAEPVLSAHAPRARNAAERLVFAQVYETLVRLDCMGAPAPWLAESWERSADGLTWTFRLRPDARFADGTAVTAEDVARSWAEGAGVARGRASLIAGIASLRARSDRELRIELESPRDDLPLVVAQSGYTVFRRDPASAWPIGTGRYTVAGAHDLDGRTGGMLVLVPANDAASRPVLTFRSFAGDLRNALDAGVDAMVSAAPGVIDYARAHPSLETVPLAWNRTYVLLAPPRPDASHDTARVAPPGHVLEQLAREVVAGDARPVASSRAAERSFACETARAAQAPRHRSRLVYREGDAVARALAERLFALARRQDAGTEWLARLLPTTPQAIEGLAPGPFAAALSAGAGAAFVATLDGIADAACEASGRTGAGGTVVPLVETRSTAIVRRGSGAVQLDGHGNLLFGAAPRRAEGSP